MAAAVVLCSVTAFAASDSPESFQVKSPFDELAAEQPCPVSEADRAGGIKPAIELMKQGPRVAAACGRYLDENYPEWVDSEEAEVLVEPLLAYLLGDGVARGMQRHDDFINLLWHLQRIAPDWRLRDDVDDILYEAIIESVAQDPFVADFWRSAIEEADLGWRESEEAKAALPVIYELAVEQQQRTDGLINERPKNLLRELSWPSYAKLILETRVFDTLLKRILILVGLLMLIAFLVATLRRRKSGRT